MVTLGFHPQNQTELEHLHCGRNRTQESITQYLHLHGHTSGFHAAQNQELSYTAYNKQHHKKALLSNFHLNDPEKRLDSIIRLKSENHFGNVVMKELLRSLQMKAQLYESTLLSGTK